MTYPLYPKVPSKEQLVNCYKMMQADYSPRAKRRDGGQQTRPISADVGRLFAVEEHSNERTGTSAVSGASSSGSHAAGGFKKGKQNKFYICYQ